ncbi:protein ACCELERATED CELL DEATH 6 [Ricinus communis]|uniref:protein ACCELERATED CELL DEATH 6 n=1 Tax=Ricinus communis TaxID=3988 RepID=UPI00201AF90D|nr:protein ACCELERATED CELL DEATH 6 [Ricinus communis]
MGSEIKVNEAEIPSGRNTGHNMSYCSSIDDDDHDTTEIPDLDSKTEDMAYMDAELYKAAVEENINSLKKYAKDLDLQVTPKKNTILHIHLNSPNKRSVDFVKEALQLCPSLLWKNNSNGDAPLHIAARYGHIDIVKLLLEQAKAQNEDLETGRGAMKQMLQMQNEKKDMALHEAARNNHLSVVRLLTRLDPHFLYPANDYEETPLYLAAARGYLYVVIEILNTCKSVAYGGPKGKTALHGAVLSGNRGIVLEILKREKRLTIEAEENGWTPLHYAAYGNDQNFGAYVIVQRLLECDKSAAYVVDKDRKRTALHLAACRGNVRIMKEIISKCPDCCEIADDRGWNVLHYAVVSKNDEALQVILRNSSLIDLVNDRDAQGNTPLHLLAVSRPYLPSFVFDGEDDLNAFYKQNVLSRDDLIHELLQPKEQILKWMKNLGNGPMGKFSINRKGSWEVQDLRSGPKEAKVLAEFERAKDSFLVVSGLVATVTFAAAFTLPGGYRSDENDPRQGTAILSKSSAFEAFIITDTIAMVLSTCSVFIHFIVMLLGYQEKYWWLIRSALLFIMFAMGAMVVAFATGTYAVLSPSLGLAVATCFIGLSFFIYVFYMLKRLYSRHLEKAYLEGAMSISKIGAKFRLSKPYFS